MQEIYGVASIFGEITFLMRLYSEKFEFFTKKVEEIMILLLQFVRKSCILNQTKFILFWRKS